MISTNFIGQNPLGLEGKDLGTIRSCEIAISEGTMKSCDMSQSGSSSN